MIFRLVILLCAIALLGCSTGKKKPPNKIVEMTPEEVENVSMNNARMAFLSRNQIQMVLVNKTNSKYLQMNKELEEKDYSKLPPTAFEYHAKTLPNGPRTSVRIVEDEVMGQLLAYAESQVNFYGFARATTWEEVEKLEKDAILIENGGKLHLLIKDERTYSRKKNVTSPGGKAWAGMKINLIRAPGHPVKTVQKGLRGDYFEHEHLRQHNRIKKRRN